VGTHSLRDLAASVTLERAFTLALAIGRELDVHGLLARSGVPALAALGRLVGPVDHVGFVRGPTPIARLVEAARLAGLVEHRTFASRVLARELAMRSGLPQVPTTIFKALGAPGVVEVFLPEAPGPVLEAWLREGVGAHVAVRLASPDQFPLALELLLEAGFVVPPGLGPRPIDNPDERVLVEYLDGVIDGAPLRLELCHSRTVAS